MRGTQRRCFTDSSWSPLGSAAHLQTHYPLGISGPYVRWLGWKVAAGSTSSAWAIRSSTWMRGVVVVWMVLDNGLASPKARESSTVAVTRGASARFQFTTALGASRR
jgi:hypothetical protein